MRMWSGNMSMLDTGWSLRPTGGGQGIEHSLVNWNSDQGNESHIFKDHRKVQSEEIALLCHHRKNTELSKKRLFLGSNADGK
jgi:hypothetical protein